MLKLGEYFIYQYIIDNSIKVFGITTELKNIYAFKRGEMGEKLNTRQGNIISSSSKLSKVHKFHYPDFRVVKGFS